MPAPGPEFLGQSSGGGAATQDYGALLRGAAEASAAGEPTDALLLLLRAVRSNRYGVEARIALAQVWEDLEHWREAGEAWQEAGRWHQLSQVQLGLARQALRSGAAGSAQRFAAAALAKDPANAQALVLLAEANERQGKAGEALSLLRQASQGDALATQLWPRLDAALRRVGDSGSANALFRRCAKELPPSPGRCIAALATAIEDGAPAVVYAALAEALGCPGWSEAQWGELWELLAQAQGLPLEGETLAGLARRFSEKALARAARAGGLGWPRRTGGGKIRVGLLADFWSEDVAGLAQRLRDVLPGEDLSLRTYALGETQASSNPAAALPLAALADIAATQAARFIAEDDCDLLVAIGDRPSGRLLAVLACRPAKWSLAWSQAALGALRYWVEARLITEAGADQAGGDGAMPVFHISDLAPGLADRVAQDLAARHAGKLAADELRARWQHALQRHRAGQAIEADRHYSVMIEDQPGTPQLLYLRGSLRREQGALRGAAADLGAALAAQPRYQEAGLALARLLFEQGNARTAAETCESLLVEAAPPDDRVLKLLGHIYRKLGRREAARDTFARLASRQPGAAAVWFDYGMAEHACGRDAEAIVALQKAAILDPGAVESFFNLAAIHQQREDFDAAAACYEQAIRLHPDEAQAYKNLGEALFALGNYPAWLGNFARFEARCPSAFSMAIYALEACQFAGDWARLDHYLNGLQQQRFQPKDAADLVDGLEELLYLLLFFDVESAELGRFYRTYAEAATKVYGPPRPVAAQRRPGRLRIGYLSGDVRDQVMGKMIHVWLEHHDRERFEVFLYGTRLGSDAWAERIRDAAEHFVPVAMLDDAAAIERIAADDLDLLIDCSTHTRGARQGILAAKPARVQITSIASAGCLGMNTIDFKLTDALADLPQMQEHQVEPLLAMAGCVYPYRELPAPSGASLRRADLGIADEAVVIGAFVNLLKLGRRCLTLWREILERVPQALIALSPTHAGQREAYQRVFQAAGIDSRRLVFIPQGRNEAQNQARYGVVDLVLDPLPFGGANGTIEALSMGVPVVTLCGRRHGERVGTSILSHLGVTGTIAHSGPEYVDIACRLVRDGDFREDLQRAIRAGLARSELTDVARHVRNLEAAYETALRLKWPELRVEPPREST